MHLIKTHILKMADRDPILLSKHSGQNFQNAKIVLLYVILIAGGFWHILGVFQEIMKFLAAPIIIFLGIWLAIEYWIVIGEENSKPHAKYQQLRFLLWGFFVVIVSFMIEWIGVKTGLIYGDYSYGNTLFPFIDQVPIAIGFAWLVMLLSSSGVAQRMFPINYFKNPYRAAFFTALLMTIFDFFMEPVAMELNYWNWSDNIVPLHNYVAWFVISYSLALLAFKNRLFLGRMPKVFYHTYFAQLIYFLMIFFA